MIPETRINDRTPLLIKSLANWHRKKKKRAQLMRVVQSQGFDVWLEDETEYGD